MSLTHLDRLEAESIHIIREVMAVAEKPVMLYSIGKDSAVMLHLALKAFAPGKLPFPLLHVDTTWKFREMIAFRDQRAKELGAELIVIDTPQHADSAARAAVARARRPKRWVDSRGSTSSVSPRRRRSRRSSAPWR